MMDTTAVKHTVLQIAREISQGKELNDSIWEQNLFELGVTSIQYLKLIVAVEEHYDIEFNEDTFDFNDYPTLESIASFILLKASHASLN
ncbi:hypothetical protein A3844_28660 [Paenibacillus helianthi]|uniref:Carrier domain-containing protein n=1 Tax=Paenibacillus helianthi TaxID=1349432 RepID=A0ABX3EG31_9BACL|nr:MULTISPECIES: acyl carrier protein [Paenibacillus]OKP79501.1 hypothetical protein A3844_28660 [Paenibacillus helianthi]OKP94755.1 hypothetical protein A3848_01920 [Paenibacillus sp. P32E]